jgi:hypothetical protein
MFKMSAKKGFIIMGKSISGIENPQCIQQTMLGEPILYINYQLFSNPCQVH